MVIIIIVVLDWRGAYDNRTEQFNFGPYYFPKKKKIVALVSDTIACACTHTQFPEIIIVVVINLTLSGIHLLRNFLKKKKETS